MDTSEIRATVLLCDSAQECKGKLYIIGGGWSIYYGSPLSMAIAAKISVPWHESNRKHEFRAVLVTEDGEPPMVLNAEGVLDQRNVELKGVFEVGRPVGLAAGTPLDASLAINIQQLALPPGRYVWQIWINDNQVDDLAFSVQPAPPSR